jgi:hypothetical protein
LIDRVNHLICSYTLMYYATMQGWKTTLILQLFMQETDELIAAIKETLTQKNVRHTTILNILQ